SRPPLRRGAASGRGSSAERDGSHRRRPQRADGPGALRRQPVLRRQPHVGGEGARAGDAVPGPAVDHRRPRRRLRRRHPDLHVHLARPRRRDLRALSRQRRSLPGLPLLSVHAVRAQVRQCGDRARHGRGAAHVPAAGGRGRRDAEGRRRTREQGHRGDHADADRRRDEDVPRPEDAGRLHAERDHRPAARPAHARVPPHLPRPRARSLRRRGRLHHDERAAPARCARGPEHRQPDRLRQHQQDRLSDVRRHPGLRGSDRDAALPPDRDVGPRLRRDRAARGDRLRLRAAEDRIDRVRRLRPCQHPADEGIDRRAQRNQVTRVSGHEGESPVIRCRPGTTLFWFLLLIVAAEAAMFLIAAGRGLDLTDESYYLLKYRYWTEWPTVSLFGAYFSGPFALFGHDVWAMRILGFVLLLGAGMWFGHEASRAFDALAERSSNDGLPAASIASAAGLWSYYGASPVPYTPSYNLLTLLC